MYDLNYEEVSRDIKYLRRGRKKRSYYEDITSDVRPLVAASESVLDPKAFIEVDRVPVPDDKASAASLDVTDEVLDSVSAEPSPGPSGSSLDVSESFSETEEKALDKSDGSEIIDPVATERKATKPKRERSVVRRSVRRRRG